MNKKLHTAKNMVLSQKKFYIFLITIMLMGIISGIIFVFFLNQSDKKEVTKEIVSFFTLIKRETGPQTPRKTPLSESFIMALTE